MKEFTLKEIASATGGRIIRGDENARIKGFSIDSREALQGKMFFAIIGPNNDGHDYLGQAGQKGCSAAAISDESKVPPDGDMALIMVENTTKALQDLAAYYLSLLPLIKKIGVTGSVGKTSTRDLMYYVASTKYKTGRNKKNYNNSHGLPLSILEFDEDTQVAVLEMGMDSPAKMEITTYFDESSTLIVNASCAMLSPERTAGPYGLVTVGTEGNRDYMVKDICDMGDKGIKFTLIRDHKEYQMSLPVPGAHNAVNAALAVAAGELIGISPQEAAEGLKRTELTGKRLKISEKNGFKVIDDTYNACEDSVISALDTLAATEGKRKVAILGDIIGLAERAEPDHKNVGAYAAKKGVDLLIAVGDDARYYAQGASGLMEEENIRYFPKKEDFIRIKDSLLREGDVILVKASRGMEMEKIVNEIIR